MAESTKDLKNKSEDMAEVENKDKGSLEKLALERIEALQDRLAEAEKAIVATHENYIKLENMMKSFTHPHETVEVEYIKECFGVKVGTKVKLLKTDAINMEKKGYVKLC